MNFKKGLNIEDMDLLGILSGKWFFSFVAATFFLKIHFYFSVGFLNNDAFLISFFERDILLASSQTAVYTFKSAYCIVSGVSLFLCAFVLYRGVFERVIKDRKHEESFNVVETTLPACPFPYDKSKWQIIVGALHSKADLTLLKNPKYLILPAEAMYQNFLITGTIGTGKTASVMYPFLKQIMFYQAGNDSKAGMLVLDVKGNFYKKVVEYAEECNRENDIVLIELDGENKYNPLHKPNMEAVDLAARSRSVIDLFSGGGKKEKFWDTKAAQMMTECIRLMRMTEGYVTLADIHGLVTNQTFLDDQLDKLCELQDSLPEFEVNACANYFQGEFSGKAENTIATIKSCVTEMTGFFASSERINRSFCPDKEEMTFKGFEDCINEGKIVVLAMNIAEYPEVSKTIAAYLKLDFQSEVQQRTSSGRLNKDRPVAFVCDEYQEFVTANDAKFYGLSRESKCCSIVSSQSYTSILQTLGSKEAFDTLQQNLINKIWLRTDDKLTIDTAQFLTGKEDKERYSKNVSESASDAKKSKIFGKMVSNKTSFSESLNVSTQRDFVFEERVFTQTLKLFKAICFTANSEGMNEPYLVHLMPYFKSPILDIDQNADIVSEKGKEPRLESELIIKMK